MGELEDKLNAILSSPETMEQIMTLANSITGSTPAEKAQEAPVPAAGAENNSLAGLLSLLGGGGNTPSQGLDPKMLQTAMTLYQEYQRGNEQTAALLLALRPFLREERCARLDRAVQITKLSHVIHAALQMFKGGGEAV